MDEHDKASVIITIPKPRVCATEIGHKNVKKGIARNVSRKPSEGSLRKYSLPGATPLQVDALKNDDLLYFYSMYAKKQNSIKHKQRLSIDLIEKYKIINTDLRNRLHVEDPADDVLAITDIDEGYYSYLNGRPLKAHIPIFKSLRYMFSKQLRLKYEVGCRRDCIINIGTKYREELEMYDASVNIYMEQVKQFDSFVSEDYQKSMECLHKCEELETRVNAKVLELENLVTEMLVIKSRLLGLNYMYGVQQKYGRFLYYLSPPSWRSKNREFARSVEIEAKGFDFGSSSEEDTFNVVFEKMCNECTVGLIKPVLFFTQPNHLMDIFETIEQQQLHHFTYVTHLAPHAKKLKEGIKELKEYIASDSASVLHVIQSFNNYLNLAEEKKSLLKSNFLKILNGLFYDSVGATEVLKLQVHLEFCYEKIYVDKPTGMTIFSTAKALEDYYMTFSYKLDEMHSNRIKKATAQLIETEKYKLKRAKVATRELRLFGRLEKALLRAHAPIVSTQQSPSSIIYATPKYKTSTSNNSREIISNNNVHELTETEIEYLSLFTDWTKDEDPAKYIHFTNEIEEHNANADI